MVPWERHCWPGKKPKEATTSLTPLNLNKKQMALFEKPFCELIDFLQTQAKLGVVRSSLALNASTWPCGGNRNFVLKTDTAVELGNPKTEALSFCIWSNQSDLIQDEKISLLGPALQESIGQSLPFGQIVLLTIEDSVDRNESEIFRALEALKYQIDLKGYMKRGASQFLREWSRISHEALEQGFSFQTLGTALIRLYKSLDYVEAAEILFITDLATLCTLKPVATQVIRTIEAMNKMLNEALVDCENCDYSDVCKDIEALRNMRKEKTRTEMSRYAR